jgi:UDP-N-acetylglucosamine pyrophosphorylase
MSNWAGIELKMRREGLSDLAIAAFQHNYQALVQGETGLVPESDIQPVKKLPRWEELHPAGDHSNLLAQVAILKLNGGLGTGMGLDRAKSLLVVKDGLSFLDLIARQILKLRLTHGCSIPFSLMNSFSTQSDSLQYLSRYSELANGFSLDFLQSKVPKLDAASLEAVTWPDNPSLEWCPPGHGDLYSSFMASGLLDDYLNSGIRYLFVSNADNLGASLDPRILRHFADQALPFMMEVAERTAADRKGGHLAVSQKSGGFLLRESAQCAAEDQDFFQDIERHRFFNTNNLWINLDALKQRLKEQGGFLPLPLIRNVKTVDPQDALSPQVYQLETAMGAAIEVFPGAGALVVPRTRFAPVKSCSDLLILRSDTYTVTEEWVLRQAGDCLALPIVRLDEKHYKKVSDFETLFAAGIPSLKGCEELTVKGRVRFSAGIRFQGKVSVVNSGGAEATLESGAYASDVSL